MNLLELLGEQKRRQRHSGTRKNSELGLPALLSIAGVIAAVILVGAASLDGWMSIPSSAPSVPAQVANAEEPDTSALYMRRKMDLLQAKIDNLEVLFQQISAGNDDLARRMQELEDKLGPYTASLGNPQESGQNRPAAKGDRASTHFKKEPESKPEKQVKKSTPAPRPTQTMFALQLPSFRTIPEMRKAWRQIRRTSGSIVSDLEPRYYALQTDNSGIVYRLLAGPIRNAADAARRCARLEALNLSCKTTVFTGEPIFQQANN